MTEALAIFSKDTTLSMVDKILLAEKAMDNFPEENKLNIVPVITFADGMVSRQITIPAGTILSGKIHKYEHFNFISQGSITVWTEEGMKRIDAPCMMVSQPGIKRIGFAHETTVWTTVHSTLFDKDDDPIDVENSLVCNTFEEYQEFVDTMKLLGGA